MQFFLLKHGESRLIEIKEANKEEDAPPVDDNIEDAACNEEKKLDDEDKNILDQLVDEFQGGEDQKEEEPAQNKEE